MAVLGKEQFLESIKTMLKDNTSDEALKFLEDASDTIGDYEERTKDSTAWKKRYEDNDAEWRKKYRDRFFKSEDKDVPDEPDIDDEEKPKKLEFSDLFKEG